MTRVCANRDGGFVYCTYGTKEQSPRSGAGRWRRLMPSERKRKAAAAGLPAEAPGAVEAEAGARAAALGALEEDKAPDASAMLAEAADARGAALVGITRIVAEQAAQGGHAALGREAERERILQIEGVVSNISFAKMLAQMETVDAAPAIPVVTRKYEENFMRECIAPGERPCMMGAACEGMFLDRAQPFVCVRFVLPNVEHGAQHMCVLCLRKTTQVLFYKTVFHGVDVRCLIQKHGNIANAPGEYGVESMLVCHPNGPVHCMPLPIVAHQRNRYSVVDIGGKKYAKQHGVDPPPF